MANDDAERQAAYEATLRVRAAVAGEVSAKICELLEPMDDDSRAEVFDLLDKAFCFKCGRDQPPSKPCHCMCDD